VDGVKVTIYNREYNLKADAEEDKYFLRQIASYLDKKISEVASSTPNKNLEQIFILASLNLAAEFFILKNKNVRVKQRLKDLLDKLTKIPR